MNLYFSCVAFFLRLILSDFSWLDKLTKKNLLEVPNRISLLDTLQRINISHLGKRKIIFKMPFLGDMLVLWRVYNRLIEKA